MSAPSWSLASCSRRPSRRLVLETLESRDVPATIVSVREADGSAALQTAITNAVPDTVLQIEGYFPGIFTITNKSDLTIMGNATLDASFQDTTLTISGSSNIEVYGITVTQGGNGSTGDAGGVQVINSTVRLRRCQFTNNAATVLGGGLQVRGLTANVLVEDSTFSGNTAALTVVPGRFLGVGEGAAVTAEASATFLRCHFVQNYGWSGATLAAQSVPALAFATPGVVRVAGNTFTTGGGDQGAAILLSGVLAGSSITQNTITKYSSGLSAGQAISATGPVTITNNTIDDVTLQYGIATNAQVIVGNNSISKIPTGTALQAPAGTINFHNNFFNVGTPVSGGIVSAASNTTFNPLYTNAASGDYRLLPASLLRHAGDASLSYNNYTGGRNTIGYEGGPRLQLTPASTSMTLSKLQATAYTLAALPYVPRENIPVAELDPPVSGNPSDTGLVYSEALAIQSTNFLDMLDGYAKAIPRSGTDAFPIQIFSDANLDGFYDPVRYPDVNVNYSSPTITPSINPTTLAEAGKVLSGVIVGHAEPGNGFPQFLPLTGDDAYARPVPFGGWSAAASLRLLGVFDAFAPAEVFPFIRDVYVSILSPTTTRVFILGDSSEATMAMQLDVTPGLETVLEMDYTLYPRHTILQTEHPELGLLGMSTMMWKNSSDTPGPTNDQAHDTETVLLFADTNADGYADRHYIHNLQNPAAGISTLRSEDVLTGKIVGMSAIQKDRDPAHYALYSAAGYHTRTNLRTEIISTPIPVNAHILTQHTDSEYNDNVAMLFPFTQNLQPATDITTGLRFYTRAIASVDLVAPTANIVQPTTPRVQPVTTVSVTVSEQVSGLATSQFSLTRNSVPVALTGATLTTTNGLTYTLTLPAALTASDGVYQLALQTPGIIDLSGNELSTAPSVSWTRDAGLVGTFGFATSTVAVEEGAGPLSLVVHRLNGTLDAVAIDYVTTAGTALAGTDYTTTSGTLHFANGETQKTFLVPIHNDNLNEANETFTVTLSSTPSDVGLHRASATVTIKPSDGQAMGELTDETGRRVQLKLHGPGVALAYLDDADGNGRGPIGVIELTGTNAARSQLTLKVLKPITPAVTSGYNVGTITGTGLRKISAAYVDFDGMGIDLPVPLQNFVGGAFRHGADFRTGGNATDPPTNLQVGAVEAGSDIVTANRLKLRTQTLGTGTISAPSISTLTVRGDYSADLVLTGANVTLGRPTLGTLNVTGNVTAAGNLTVNGAIGKVQAAGFYGMLNATAMGKFRTTGDVSGTITLTGPALQTNAPVLGTWDVRGTVQQATISVNGDINRFTAFAFRDSTLFAGSTPPSVPFEEFDSGATIHSFNILGPTNAFANSYITAGVIRKAKLKSVQVDNGGTTFGFWAKRLDYLRVEDLAFEFPTQQIVEDFKVAEDV